MARVGVDLDGVLYDFNDALRRYIGGNLETHPEPTVWSYWTEWKMVKAEFWETVAAGVDAGVIFGTGGIAPGAIFWMNQMRSAGHTLHIVTARSSGRPATPALASAAEINTRHWIQRFHVPYDTLTFAHDKTSVPTDVFVEDKLGNYDALEAAGSQAWLIDRPCNQQEGCTRRRVASFEKFAQAVLAQPAAAA